MKFGKEPHSQRCEGVRTPWGAADTETVFTPDIALYLTPSHGGIKVSDTLNGLVPQSMRRNDGWYEEDCNWAIVVVAFPRLFSLSRLKAAVKTMQFWHGDTYREWRATTRTKNQSRLFPEQAGNKS